MAVTNTKFKIVERDRRDCGDTSKHGDYVTQPRLLQPVADADNITVANGFVPANLKPGDMVLCDVATGETTVSSLCIRHPDNNGWIEIKFAAASALSHAVLSD